MRIILRRITSDMTRPYTKVRAGGIIGGDDYSPGIWQLDDRFAYSRLPVCCLFC